MTVIQSPYAQTAGSISILTTEGDMLYENAAKVNARLAIGTAGEMLGISGGIPFWLPALNIQASTATGGFALQDATPTVISWSVPNDGLLHWAIIFAGMDVTTAPEVGGLVQSVYTLPDGTGPAPHTLFAAALASSGEQVPSNTFGRPVEAGSTVSVVQASALTSGAATLWASIWGY